MPDGRPINFLESVVAEAKACHVVAPSAHHHHHFAMD